MKYKYDVFISYSRRDYVDESYNVIPGNAIAEIQNVFDENGITYWFDKDGIYSGQEFIEIITGAIAESKMLIFISSKHSNESMWTAGEIFEALDGEKACDPEGADECGICLLCGMLLLYGNCGARMVRTGMGSITVSGDGCDRVP